MIVFHISFRPEVKVVVGWNGFCGQVSLLFFFSLWYHLITMKEKDNIVEASWGFIFVYISISTG